MPLPAPRRRHRTHLGNDSRGLTLVEVLVAVAILAVAIIPLYRAVNVGFQGVKAGEDSLVGLALLERAVEETKASAADSFPPSSIPDPGQADYGAGEGVNGYSLIRTVTAMDWKDADNQDVVVRVEIRIRKGGRTVGRTTFLLHREGI